MMKLLLRALAAIFLLTLGIASSLAQTGAPKYVSKPGETYFDFGDEPIRYIENDRVKVGFNLAIGGAVVYLEDKKNNSGNMINSFDWGRQIQLSYYSGPRPFIGPNGEEPAKQWAGLGWNPIQAGDCGGYGSRVLEFKTIGANQARVKTRPMLWPNIGLLAECVFECQYRLTQNGFELTATIVNDRSDKTQYSACGQETPALYTNAPWYKLVTYLGDEPFANKPVSVLVDKGDGLGWPWLNYYSPEHWSALVNDEGFGVGVYAPHSVRTAAGFAGGDANKGRALGEKTSPTGYIAPTESMILDWNAKHVYKTTFIVGSVDEIRKTVYRLARKDVPKTPEWEFTTDRLNWTYEAATDDGCDLGGEGLTINLSAVQTSTIKSPDMFWKTENAKSLEISGDFLGDASDPIDMITIAATPVSPADSQWYLQWSEGDKDSKKDREQKEREHPRLADVCYDVDVERASDGKWRVRLDLTQNEAYRGAMRQLKIIVPKRDAKANIRSVKFSKDAL